MTIHDYTISELEQIVFNQSKCYADSVAFQICLEAIKKLSPVLYKDVLYKEALACGGLD